MKYWILLLCLPLLVNCGEPVPIDCTPDQEQCTTENEGGFQTGSAAGIAAGAAGVALLAGGISGGSGGDGGGSGSSSNAATTATPAVKIGQFIDSAVAGVSYQTSSGLSAAN